MRYRTMTRNEARRAKLAGAIKVIALAVLLVVLLVTLAITDEPTEQSSEAERWAQFKAQERYYEALDLYGDVEGAAEAARLVFEREVADHAED